MCWFCTHFCTSPWPWFKIPPSNHSLLCFCSMDTDRMSTHWHLQKHPMGNIQFEMLYCLWREQKLYSLATAQLTDFVTYCLSLVWHWLPSDFVTLGCSKLPAAIVRSWHLHDAWCGSGLMAAPFGCTSPWNHLAMPLCCWANSLEEVWSALCRVIQRYTMVLNKQIELQLCIHIFGIRNQNCTCMFSGFEHLL